MRIKFLFTFLLFTCFCSLTKAQTADPYYQSIVDNVSYDTLLKNLQIFESYGVKNLSSQGIENTKNWLLSQYANYGYADVVLDSFYKYGEFQYNIIVTKTGTFYPDSFLIIGGHYDTYMGPGVDDNGSGTCIILEAARLLHYIPTTFSIRFIHFTGEEGYGFGSNHYVDSVVVPQDMKIRLYLNIDMVGGVAGMENDTILCERDMISPISNNTLSAAFTDTLKDQTEVYSSLKGKLDSAWGSDYLAFQEVGEVITGYFENHLTTNPYWHTLNDTLGNLDTSTVFEVCKASVGSALYLAQAYNPSEIDEGEMQIHNIHVYPNPFHNDFNISTTNKKEEYSLVIYNCLGQIMSMQDFVSFIKINDPSFRPGIYFYEVKSKNNAEIYKGKICSK